MSALLALGLLLPACGGDDPGAESVGDGTAEAEGSAAAGEIQGYGEGAELPEGWPADLIPLPEGAIAVASLDKTAVSDEEGEGLAVFYAIDQTPEQIQQFLLDALPAKGWTIQETTPPDQYVMISAENQGYVGIFGIGSGFGPEQTTTGQPIDLQVLLVREL